MLWSNSHTEPTTQPASSLSTMTMLVPKDIWATASHRSRACSQERLEMHRMECQVTLMQAIPRSHLSLSTQPLSHPLGSLTLTHRGHSSLLSNSWTCCLRSTATVTSMCLSTMFNMRILTDLTDLSTEVTTSMQALAAALWSDSFSNSYNTINSKRATDERGQDNNNCH